MINDNERVTLIEENKIVLKDKEQLVTFKTLNYCFKETIGFDVKASSASLPVPRLIK